VLCYEDFARKLFEIKTKLAGAQLRLREPACLLVIRDMGDQGDTASQAAGIKESAHSSSLKLETENIFQADFHRPAEA
jgi:hypothetical protein